MSGLRYVVAGIAAMNLLLEPGRDHGKRIVQLACVQKEGNGIGSPDDNDKDRHFDFFFLDFLAFDIGGTVWAREHGGVCAYFGTV